MLNPNLIVKQWNANCWKRYWKFALEYGVGKKLIKDINSKRNGMQIAVKVIESLLLNMVLRKKKN
jgi:hypothetical protein